jgi:dipeptidase E
LRTIVAIGGGSTTDSIREYTLGLTGKERPKLLYLDTASAHDPRQTLRMLQTYSRVADVELVEFFPWPPDGLRELTLGRDLVLVGGGNTVNMLAIWRAYGFDEILREAYDREIVLAGSSAGMICWFEAGVTDSFGPRLAGLRDGLGFLAGSACPHYDDEELRRTTYRRLVDEEGFPPGLAADSGVALRFADGELAEVVSPREGATAYRVEPGSETPLEARIVSA